MKTCRLMVSARAYLGQPPAAVSRRHGFGMPASFELTSGHRLDVTGKEFEEWRECVTERGETVWIDERWVTHAE